MKKILSIAILLSLTPCAYAIPMIDSTAGNMPFRIIQQTIMEQQEAEDMQAKEDRDNKKINKIKQPTKMDLQNFNNNPSQSTDMQIIQQDGKVILKQMY